MFGWHKSCTFVITNYNGTMYRAKYRRRNSELCISCCIMHSLSNCVVCVEDHQLCAKLCTCTVHTQGRSQKFVFGGI